MGFLTTRRGLSQKITWYRSWEGAEGKEVEEQVGMQWTGVRAEHRHRFHTVKKHRSTSLCCYQSDPMPKEMRMIYMHQWGYFQLTLTCPTSEFFPGFPLIHPWGSRHPVQDQTLLTTVCPWGPQPPWRLTWGRGSPVSSIHSRPNLCIFQDVIYNLKCQETLTKKTKATLLLFFFLIGLKPSEQQIKQDEWKCWQYQLTSLL